MSEKDKKNKDLGAGDKFQDLLNNFKTEDANSKDAKRMKRTNSLAMSSEEKEERRKKGIASIKKRKGNKGNNSGQRSFFADTNKILLGGSQQPDELSDENAHDENMTPRTSTTDPSNHPKLSSDSVDVKRTYSADDISRKKNKYVSRLSEKRKWYKRGVLGRINENLKNVGRKISSIGKSSSAKFASHGKRLLIYTIANHIYKDPDSLSDMTWDSWRSKFKQQLIGVTNLALDFVDDSGARPTTDELDIAIDDAIKKEGSTLKVDDNYRNNIVWWVRNVVGYIYSHHGSGDVLNQKVTQINEDLIQQVGELKPVDVLLECELDPFAFLTPFSGRKGLKFTSHFNKILLKIQSWLKELMAGKTFGDFVKKFIVASLSGDLKSHRTIIDNFRIGRNDKVNIKGLTNTRNYLQKSLSPSELSELENRLKVSLTSDRADPKSLDALAMYFIMVSEFKPGDMSSKWKDYNKWGDLFRNESFPLYDRNWVELLKHAWQEKNISEAKKEVPRVENLSNFPKSMLFKLEKRKTDLANYQSTKVAGSSMTNSSSEIKYEEANGIKYDPIKYEDLRWPFQGVSNYSDGEKNDPLLKALQDNQKDFQKHVGYCLEVAKTPILYYNYVNGKGMKDEKGNPVSDVTSKLSWSGKGSGKADVNNYCEGFGNLLDEELKKYEGFANNIYSNNNDNKKMPDGVDKNDLSKSYKELKDYALKQLKSIKGKGLQELQNLAKKDALKNCFITDICTRISNNVKWDNVFKYISAGDVNQIPFSELEASSDGTDVQKVRTFVGKVIAKGLSIIEKSKTKDLPVVTDSLNNSLNNLKSTLSKSINTRFLDKKSKAGLSNTDKEDIKKFCNENLGTNF